MHIFLPKIIRFTCSCLCRWMSLFSSLCGCRSGGTLTQTVSQLLGGAACCRFRLLSHSLSLSALERLLLTGRTSVGQLFQNSSSEALRRFPGLLCSSFLCLQHLSLPVCRRRRWNPILSSSAIPSRRSCGSISWRDRQRSLKGGGKWMWSVESLLLCFPAAESQSHSLPKQSGRNTLSHSLCSSRHSPPPFSHSLTHVIPFYHSSHISFTFFGSHSILSFCNLFLPTSASLPHLLPQRLPDTITTSERWNATLLGII